jgi:hypothetical protein
MSELAFHIDKSALKLAASDFKTALLKVKEGCKGCHEEKMVDNLLEGLNPIFDLCEQMLIDEPFSFQSYVMSFAGKTLSDELGHPEMGLTEPYYYLSSVFRGGLTYDEFWNSKYYLERLMPKAFKAQSKEPEYTPSAATLKILGKL